MYIIICKKRVYIILSLVLNVYENIEINSMLKVYKDMNFFWNRKLFVVIVYNEIYIRFIIVLCDII